MPGYTEELTNEDDVPVVTDLLGTDDLLVMRPGVDPVNSRNPDGYGLIRAPYSIVQATAGVAGASWYTLTQLLESVIPPAVDVLVTSGFYEPGDGGDALLRRVGADPGHTGAWADASGQYFELVPWSGRVNVLQFGAKVLTATVTAGSGFDSTAFVHAAWDYAKARDLVTLFPPGAIRVTSGYSNSTAYHDIKIDGVGFSSRRFSAGQLWKTSTIVLDNTDPASFILYLSGNNEFHTRGLVYSAAQIVKDRKLIRLAQNNGRRQTIRDVGFKGANKSIVFEEGSYFQFSVMENIHFIDSGTIYTEPGATGDSRLLGTGLTLNNISHDGTVPDATDKVVMDLSGIRNVQGEHLLLEGLLPGTGWTVYRHASPYDDFWIRSPIASYSGVWFEFSGTQPAVMLDLDSGRYDFRAPVFVGLGAGGNGKVKLGTNTIAHFFQLAIADTTDTTGCFVREDESSHVELHECTLRGTQALPYWIAEDQCTQGATAPTNEMLRSNTQGALVARWDGGVLDGTLLSAAFVGGGGAIYPSTDSVFGRKLVMTPPAGSSFRSAVATRAERFNLRDPVAIIAKVKLPTFTAGSIGFSVGRSSIDWTSVAYGPDLSGQVVDVCVAAPMQDVSAGGLSFYIFTVGTMADLAGDLEVYALEFFKGNDAPRSVHSSFPRNIITFAEAPPSVGGWTQGDIVYDPTPTAGGVPGWVCTATGTPGTWKAMAALAS